MSVVYEARWLFLSGTLFTLAVFSGASIIAGVCAFLAGLARIAPIRLLRILAICYIELFRGTSVVVQLFWLYFALPFFGIRIEAYQAAVLGLGLCFGAYGAEIVRGAILAVQRGQVEASTALNMTYNQRMRIVILPQAFVVMLPSIGNLLVLLLKATSSASFITIPELTFQAYALNVRTLATVQIFTAVLLVYFALAQLLTQAVRYLERKAGLWRRREIAQPVSGTAIVSGS